MKRQMMVLALGGAILVGGCDWTSTSETQAWNDSYSWINFSGVYRAADGVSPIVTGATTSGSSAYVKTENFGKTGDGNFTYTGTVSQAPVVAGSVTVRLGNTATFSDDGSGNLTQVGGGGAGSISYATGAWSANPEPDGAAGESISVTYQVAGTTGTAVPGNTGAAVYNITVNQTGNLIHLTDSRGKSFAGQITGSGGVTDATEAGSVRLIFQATSADGTVTIKGAFTGDWTGAAINPDGETTSGGVLTNRQMEGTWIEGKVQGSIVAVSGETTTAVIPGSGVVTPGTP